MFDTRPKAILYLFPNGFYFYLSSSVQIYSLSFAPDIVRDLEIIEKEKFDGLLRSFFDAYKIPPCVVTVLLSPNVVYEKDFQIHFQQFPHQFPFHVPGMHSSQTQSSHVENDGEIEKHTKEVAAFVDLVPFDHVLSKEFTTLTGVRVVAVNQELIDRIESVCKEKHSVLDAVVPYFLFTEIVHLSGNFTTNVGHALIAKYDVIKHNSMIHKSDVPLEIHQTASSVENKSNKSTPKSFIDHEEEQGSKRPYVLGGILVVLFIILGIVYYYSSKQDDALKKKTSIVPSISPNTATKVAPTIALQPTIIGTKEVPNVLNTDIQILLFYDSESVDVADAVGLSLSEKGFKKVTKEIRKNQESDKTIIIVKSSVSQVTRDSVLSSLEKNNMQAAIQENNELKIDMAILLGKKTQ